LNPLTQQQQWQSSIPSPSLRLSSCQYSHDNMLTKSTLRPLSERPRMPSFDRDPSAQRNLDGDAAGDGMTLGEERMVKERYEDTNRYSLSCLSLSLLIRGFEQAAGITRLVT
jgi:hypothetical protein